MFQENGINLLGLNPLRRMEWHVFSGVLVEQKSFASAHLCEMC